MHDDRLYIECFRFDPFNGCSRRIIVFQTVLPDSYFKLGWSSTNFIELSITETGEKISFNTFQHSGQPLGSSFYEWQRHRKNDSRAFLEKPSYEFKNYFYFKCQLIKNIPRKFSFSGINAVDNFPITSFRFSTFNISHYLHKI